MPNKDWSEPKTLSEIIEAGRETVRKAIERAEQREKELKADRSPLFERWGRFGTSWFKRSEHPDTPDLRINLPGLRLQELNEPYHTPTPDELEYMRKRTFELGVESYKNNKKIQQATNNPRSLLYPSDEVEESNPEFENFIKKLNEDNKRRFG